MIVEEIIGDRLIYPRDVVDREWPLLAESRGKILLILDEGGEKRDLVFEKVGKIALCSFRSTKITKRPLL